MGLGKQNPPLCDPINVRSLRPVIRFGVATDRSMGLIVSKDVKNVGLAMNFARTDMTKQ